MASFTGKTFASFYPNIISVDQTSGSGIGTIARKIQDGVGNNTCLFLSDDEFWIRPENDNNVGTFLIYDKDGNVLFKADTSNKIIRAGSGQVAVNTQYAHFGCNSGDPTTAAMLADTHYAIPFTIAGFGGTIANFAMGSSTSSSFNDTNPATSLTISATAMDIVTAYWYVMDDITIDAVKWLHAADTATGEATAGHLMAYTVDIANGSTGGDLSSGVVVADGANITNAGYEQIYYQSMTVQSADVDAGKVILFTFASDTVNSDYSINATIKYHLR